MLDGYAEHMRRKRRATGTIRLRLFYINKFSHWFGRDLLEATHDDFENYIFSNPDWSQNTQQCVTATLKSFYGWATREGHLPLNPTRDLAKIVVHRKRPRIASEPAIAHALTIANPVDQAMVLLGAECGLRVTEIATLHRNNRDGDWLHIIGKGNKQRSMKLSPELLELLEHLEATVMYRGWYFIGRSRRGPIHSSTAWRHISAVLQSNPHSLRRRAGTVVYRQSGKDVRLAQVFLGHANTAVTSEYLDVQDDDLAMAATLTRIGTPRKVHFDGSRDCETTAA